MQSGLSSHDSSRPISPRTPALLQRPRRPDSRGAGGIGSTSRSSLLSGGSASKRDSMYRAEDVVSLPTKLGSVLLQHRARALDLFRSMDVDGDGTLSRSEFVRGVRALGLVGPTDPEDEIEELFAQFDVDGNGMLDYEELSRLLKVGQASRVSEYTRAATAGIALPSPFTIMPNQRDLRKVRPTPPRARDPAARSGPSMPAGELLPDVREGEWPASLRGLLLRERQRVIDLFRHWEGGEGGAISVEHFVAGLHVLGYRIPRAEVQQLFGAMGVEEGGALRFVELRRQVRVVTQRGCSSYLREAAKQGAELEASTPRGALVSGVADRHDAAPPLTPQDSLAAALLLSQGPGSASTMRELYRGGSFGGIASSSLSEAGVVGLGADSAPARHRALAAAAEAAHAVASGSQSLLAAEMLVQQWARSHYSALLPELRKWELYPQGLITFEVFADSLHALGFPAAGRWQEIEAVFYSWEPDEHGRIHWNAVRARMTGGRLVRVQATKHNTASYFKQASRAGEGFGNRSSSRFEHQTPSFLGPGKYTPDPVAKPKGVGHHSGRLHTTAPRFAPPPASQAPGPGRYKPKHTLIDGRHEIPQV